MTGGTLAEVTAMSGSMVPRTEEGRPGAAGPGHRGPTTEPSPARNIHHCARLVAAAFDLESAGAEVVGE